MILRRALASFVVVALVAPAAAEPRTAQVLKTQGKIDAATRTKLDGAILVLAKADSTATAGDITFADAAAALGCKPEAAACRDEVREMLAVDEIVYATATKTPTGLDVTVYRVGKGGTARELKTTIASGQPADRLDSIAPLFASTTAPLTTTEPVPATTTPPPATTTTDPQPPTTGDPPLIDATLRDGQPTTTATATPPTTSAPVDAPTHPNRRIHLAGMIGGGAMVFVGFMCWGAASNIQDEVDAAPTGTRAQIMELQELENRGDGYAGLGNFLFLAGAVVGGISTYYFVKGRRRTQAAVTATRITPTVFEHGAGVIIGGSL